MYSAFLREFGSPAIVRHNLDGTSGQIIVTGGGAGTPRGVGIDHDESPLTGTGFALENPAAGLDAYVEVMPTVPELSEVDPIPSNPGLVKDIARDPVSGLLYTIDLTSGPTGQRLYPTGPCWVVDAAPESDGSFRAPLHVGVGVRRQGRALWSRARDLRDRQAHGSSHSPRRRGYDARARLRNDVVAERHRVP
ncbi:MAG: hypothetical protein ACRD3V_20490 [Vicinamibacteria bacterium]